MLVGVVLPLTVLRITVVSLYKHTETFHFINYTAADVRTKCYHNNWLCAQGSVPDQRWHHNAQQPNSYDMPSCVIMVQCK